MPKRSLQSAVKQLDRLHVLPPIHYKWCLGIALPLFSLIYEVSVYVFVQACMPAIVMGLP